MTDLTRLFADVDAAAPAEPAVPPGYLEDTLARARRSTRRRRAVGAAVAALLVVAVTAAVPWPRHPLHTVPAEPVRPSLPAEFPAYSPLTASATGSPAGRAIALYEFGSSEMFTSWQLLAAGADRDSYRRLDTGARPPEPISPTGDRLLSPDGTRVLLYDYPSSFIMIDLTTGATTRLATVQWTTIAEAAPKLLAWSPDGHTVLYAVPAPPPVYGRVQDSYRYGRPIMELATMDLLDGSTERTAVRSVWAAAFAPDGRSLAVQSGPGDAWITAPNGGLIRRLDLPAGQDIVSGVAFSPDGTLIATVSAPDSTAQTIFFLDATGTDRPVPRPLPYDNLVGWRSSTSIVVQTWSDELDSDVLAEVSLADGTATVLSRFSRASTCEYGLQRCHPYRVQLASDLLPHAGIRSSAPERWLLPLWVEQAIEVGAALAVGATVVLIWTVARRGRRRD